MYKIIIGIAITLYFIFQLFIKILSYKSRNREIPEELADVYDNNMYHKWMNYSSELIKLDIIETIISYIVLMCLLMSNIFSIFFGDFDNYTLSSLYVILMYVGVTSVFDILFDYFKIMVIEEKYGFNKRTKKTFIGDEIKKIIISFALLIFMSMSFKVSYENIGDYTLIVFTIVVFLFSLFISFIYPYTSRINNKFVSLEDGELRDSLTKLLKKYHYRVRDIKVMDASRRTTKLNAYFTGFGKSKTIVLFDNLLNKLSNEEIVAVFAHEMGHGIHKDTLKSSLMSIITMFIMALLAWLLIKYPVIYQDFGFDFVNYGLMIIILFNAIIPFVSVVIGIVKSYISRRFEYRADLVAAKEGYGEYLISGLKNLFRDNLGNLNPHPLIVILSYSHPTLLQRINAIRRYEGRNDG